MRWEFIVLRLPPFAKRGSDAPYFENRNTAKGCYFGKPFCWIEENLRIQIHGDSLLPVSPIHIIYCLFILFCTFAKFSLYPSWIGLFSTIRTLDIFSDNNRKSSANSQTNIWRTKLDFAVSLWNWSCANIYR